MARTSSGSSDSARAVKFSRSTKRTRDAPPLGLASGWLLAGVSTMPDSARAGIAPPQAAQKRAAGATGASQCGQVVPADSPHARAEACSFRVVCARTRRSASALVGPRSRAPSPCGSISPVTGCHPRWSGCADPARHRVVVVDDVGADARLLPRTGARREPSMPGTCPLIARCGLWSAHSDSRVLLLNWAIRDLDRGVEELPDHRVLLASSVKSASSLSRT